MTSLLESPKLSDNITGTCFSEMSSYIFVSETQSGKILCLKHLAFQDRMDYVYVCSLFDPESNLVLCHI